MNKKTFVYNDTYKNRILIRNVQREKRSFLCLVKLRIWKAYFPSLFGSEFQTYLRARVIIRARW